MTNFDVIIIGGSYAGLAAALTMGRSLRKTLVIDNGAPCNKPSAHAHNFLTHDGDTPNEIRRVGKEEVQQYDTVQFKEGTVVKVEKQEKLFLVETQSGEQLFATKVIIATGVRDILPDTPGFKETWGKSLIHCPYCHGYEVRSKPTGLIANGPFMYDFTATLKGWTDKLTLFTNGPCTLTEEQQNRFKTRGIGIVETKVKKLVHNDGNISKVVLDDGSSYDVDVVYYKPAFAHTNEIHKQLGLEMTEMNFIKVDMFQKTNIPGVYAAGDVTTMYRAVSTAISAGMFAACMANLEIAKEEFQ